MLRILIALLQVGAGSIHLLLAPQEWRQDPIYGLAFMVMGLGQVLLAAMMLSRHRPVLLFGILWNLGIAALWIVTRTVGIPIGAEAGARVQISVPDSLTTALEITAVTVLLVLLGSRRPKLIRRSVALGVTGGAGAVLLAGFTYAASANRSLCTHFDPSYGPLAAVEGHSLLPRTAPGYLLRLGKEATIKAGVLINCGSEPVRIQKVEVLSAAGDAAQVTGLMVLPVTHPQRESSSHLDRALDPAPVPPTAKQPDMGIFARFLPVRQGSFFLNGLRISYFYKTGARTQLFSTNVATKVATRP